MHIVYGVQMNYGCECLMIGYDHTGQLVLLDQIVIGEEPIIDEHRLFFDHGANVNHFFHRYGKQFFQEYGKEFFLTYGKQNFQG